MPDAAATCLRATPRPIHAAIPGPAVTHLCATLLLILAAAPAAAQEPAEWFERSHDVYLDGVLDPAAVVLGARQPARLAVLAAPFAEAWIVDLERAAVSRQPASSFTLADDGSGARAPGAARQAPEARATIIDSAHDRHYLLSVPGHSILLGPHQGRSGAITVEELWQARPSWRRRADRHEVDPAVVAALAAVESDTRLVVALGTWCGDSRKHVPALLRTLELADNPHLALELVSLQRGFESPLALIRDRRLTNVPTVLVARDGVELGRLVESPVGDSMAGDLATLLAAGALPPHPGALSRERTLARGVYRHLDAGGRTVATERFALHATSRDRRLLHSRLHYADGGVVEVFHRTGVDGASDLIEVTRTDAGAHSRTRAWPGEDGAVSAITRGDRTGIVRQTVPFADGDAFYSPCAADAAAGWFHRGRPSTAAIRGLRVPGLGGAAAGQLIEITHRGDGEETLDTAAGPLPTQRVAQLDGGGETTWWLEARHGLPVAARFADGGRLELVSLALDPDA